MLPFHRKAYVHFALIPLTLFTLCMSKVPLPVALLFSKALLFYSTCRLCCACIYTLPKTPDFQLSLLILTLFSVSSIKGVLETFFSLFNKYVRQLEAKRLHATVFELILHSKEHSFRYQGSINQSYAQKCRISNFKKYS